MIVEVKRRAKWWFVKIKQGTVRSLAVMKIKIGW